MILFYNFFKLDLKIPQKLKLSTLSLTDVRLLSRVTSSIKRRERPRKTSLDCVIIDIKDRCLTHTDPQDRILWRAAVRQCLLLPSPSDGTRTAL